MGDGAYLDDDDRDGQLSGTEDLIHGFLEVVDDAGHKNGEDVVVPDVGRI